MPASRSTMCRPTALKLVDPEAQTLARLVDYVGQEKAASSMAVFENRLGGRIAVCRLLPWTFLHSLSKSAQMKSVMRWLSHDRLPAYVASFHKVNLWAREAQARRTPRSPSSTPALIPAIRTWTWPLRTTHRECAQCST